MVGFDDLFSHEFEHDCLPMILQLHLHVLAFKYENYSNSIYNIVCYLRKGIWNIRVNEYTCTCTGCN